MQAVVLPKRYITNKIPGSYRAPEGPEPARLVAASSAPTLDAPRRSAFSVFCTPFCVLKGGCKYMTLSKLFLSRKVIPNKPGRSTVFDNHFCVQGLLEVLPPLVVHCRYCLTRNTLLPWTTTPQSLLRMSQSVAGSQAPLTCLPEQELKQ